MFHANGHAHVVGKRKEELVNAGNPPSCFVGDRSDDDVQVEILPRIVVRDRKTAIDFQRTQKKRRTQKTRFRLELRRFHGRIIVAVDDIACRGSWPFSTFFGDGL